jgi:hypothetical protein
VLAWVAAATVSLICLESSSERTCVSVPSVTDPIAWAISVTACLVSSEERAMSAEAVATVGEVGLMARSISATSSRIATDAVPSTLAMACR